MLFRWKFGNRWDRVISISIQRNMWSLIKKLQGLYLMLIIVGNVGGKRIKLLTCVGWAQLFQLEMNLKGHQKCKKSYNFNQIFLRNYFDIVLEWNAIARAIFELEKCYLHQNMSEFLDNFNEIVL